MLTTSKKKIAHDAARAVRRVSSLDIQTLTPETLTLLLGLPELRVVGFALETDTDMEYLHLFCEHSHAVAMCPDCGAVMAGGYDSKEEHQLRLILEAVPELRTVYLFKEELRTLCEKIKPRDRAERFLRSWVLRAEASNIRYLKRFAKTLRNWWPEFLNYFVDGVTQGFVEGIKRAFGFHKFEHFRLQVLVECGGI